MGIASCRILFRAYDYICCEHVGEHDGKRRRVVVRASDLVSICEATGMAEFRLRPPMTGDGFVALPELTES